MASKKFYDPEYDRLVDESEIRRQYNCFTKETWFDKTYEQFKRDNFLTADMTEIKEEETMETKTTFTTISGNTFTTNESGTYFYMIDTNGKKIRIKKSEFEAAQRENELERKMSEMDNAAENNSVSLEEFCDMVTDANAAQAELDKDPCHVDPMADLYTPAVIDENGCVDCRECNVKECVHRNCMRRNPRNVGGLGECPRLDVKVEEPDEAQDPELEEIMEETGLEASDAELERNIRNEQKKPRRSKDIAYEGHGVTLTAKQVDFLRELRKTGLFDIDGNMVVEDITITIGGQFEDKPMTVGAMISTLCEKHLGTRIKVKVEKRTMTAFGFTPNGRAVMNVID